MYEIVTIPRQTSVIVKRDGKINYVASCNVFHYGDRSCMYTINGEEFYKASAQPGVLAKLFNDLQTSTLEGYVTEAHARLMRVALRRVATVELAHEGTMAGEKMVWVIVRVKEAAAQ